MAPLLNAGTAWRGATGVPQRFSLRVYVAEADLDEIYAPLVPRAVSPETGGGTQLAEELTRLAAQERGALPPTQDPLWRLPFSTAPLARRELLSDTPDFPVYHAPQRLRRTMQLVSTAEQKSANPLITLLLQDDEIRDRGRSAEPEHFLPVYARESDWSVPISWFALFKDEDRAPADHDGEITHRLAVPADVAARRAAWSAKVLGELEHDDLQELAEDLGRLAKWSATFSAASLICLDYGSIADSIQPDGSPLDFDDAIHLIDDGDLDSAGVALRRLMMRWMPLAHLEHAS
ncbi:hypothetical protein FCK90_09530 [Kocuria coralli]|uniref:DUF8083 domain-containing protein n=1 Tax=Kocuria coralli TaxID=1461025 RepID=A0A5J5KYM7_9MICC|nr:hypothetical protein [Kocuria coralli]KAA9393896.1 hypothetical protein FCK90_09530 [Kocuria coralli]